MGWYCPNDGTENSFQSRSCEICGYKISNKERNAFFLQHWMEEAGKHSAAFLAAVRTTSLVFVCLSVVLAGVQIVFAFQQQSFHADIHAERLAASLDTLRHPFQEGGVQLSPPPLTFRPVHVDGNAVAAKLSTGADRLGDLAGGIQRFFGNSVNQVNQLIQSVERR